MITSVKGAAWELHSLHRHRPDVVTTFVPRDEAISVTASVRAFPAPTTTSGELVDFEADPEARVVLHRRVDRLPRDVLFDCALKAGEDVEGIRTYLHEAIDTPLASYNEDLAVLAFEGRTWLATGGGDSGLERSFWQTLALAISGVTDAPIRGTRITKSDPAWSELSALLPLFIAEVVRGAGFQANVSASVLDAIIFKLESTLEGSELELQALVRRGLLRARFDGVISSDVYVDEES